MGGGGGAVATQKSRDISEFGLPARSESGPPERSPPCCRLVGALGAAASAACALRVRNLVRDLVRDLIRDPIRDPIRDLIRDLSVT